MVGVIFKSIFDTFLMQTELKFFFVSTGNSHNYSEKFRVSRKQFSANPFCKIWENYNGDADAEEHIAC
jgi:hypothetical protein